MNFLNEIFYNNLNIKHNKKVTFSNTIDVILVPKCSEYLYLKNELWWSNSECDFFFKSSVSEIRKFIRNYEYNIAFKTGRDLLYQPGNVEYEDSCYN